MIQPIPAIDLLNGQCVRLRRGRYDQVTTYGDDAVHMAVHWASLGAQWLHVVDLDAAASGGSTNNASLIARICEAIEIPVQTGGGLRTLGDIERTLTAGASRVILGTVAARHPTMVTEAITRFGAQHVAVGIDAKDNVVRVQGWTEDGGFDAADLALDMQRRGVRRIIYTDIHRDGMMQGPNLDAYRVLGDMLTTCKVTASGGIASYGDVKALAPLAPIGIDSVIIGRALYERAIDPKELWP